MILNLKATLNFKNILNFKNHKNKNIFKSEF